MEYFESRISLWLGNAESIGITDEQATALKTAAELNRAQFNAMDVARNSAKAATNTFYASNNTLTDLGRNLIKTIKAYAQTTNDPMVYSLANIDPPAPPTPVPAPSVPADTTGSVTPDGVVTLSWRADRSGASSGIFFIIERKRAGEADYSVLSATVEKSFMDPNARVNLGLVQYRIKAVRGTESSDWATPVVFNFGAGGGSLVFNAGESVPVKLAA